MALINCPECKSNISDQAYMCPSCGYEVKQKQPEPSLGIAAILSFFIPGLGQLYKGQILNGLLWLALVVVGYSLFLVPGLILHLFCIIGAVTQSQVKKRKKSFNEFVVNKRKIVEEKP